jgi:hypothetical protein
MELNNGYHALTRLQRARLVGQYHLYNAFGDLRTWAAWHNGLDASERSFVRFYRQVNQPGALDWADVRRVPPNETLGVRLGIDPEMGERFSRAFSIASASMGANAGVYAEYGQSIARVAKVNAYPFAKVNTPGMGTYIGATKEAKPIDSARMRKAFVREAFRLRLKHHPVFGIRLPRMVRDIAARYIPMSFISFWERFP